MPANRCMWQDIKHPLPLSPPPFNCTTTSVAVRCSPGTVYILPFFCNLGVNTMWYFHSHFMARKVLRVCHPLSSFALRNRLEQSCCNAWEESSCGCEPLPTTRITDGFIVKYFAPYFHRLTCRKTNTPGAVVRQVLRPETAFVRGMPCGLCHCYGNPFFLGFRLARNGYREHAVLEVRRDVFAVAVFGQRETAGKA